MLEEIELYAREERVPIMMKDGIEYLCNYIKENNIKNILEIGSAIGYSAIKMALVDSDIKVTTIEKDENRYNVAVDNINKFSLNDRINIILGDALETNIEGVFDLIFIDASKGKYLEFFNYALELLSDNGIIIADNVLYKGMVLSDYNGHKHRTAVRKLRNFLEYIQNLEGYSSRIENIGDGISITYKKEELIDGTKDSK